MTHQYDEQLATKYSSGKRFEHPIGRMNYETWLNTLGEVAGKHILDLACGSGYSSRLLAERGAIVTGVDISPEMIALAQTEEEYKPLGITYMLADAATLRLDSQFDVVTPSYLLHYAENKEQLRAFAETVAWHLKRGDQMIALHANDQPIVPLLPNGQHSTEWVKGDVPWQEGSRVLLHLYDLSGRLVCDIVFYYWSKETYRTVLNSVGLIDVKWVKIQMSDEAKKLIPNWRELAQYNTSCVLVATKF